MMPKKFIPLNDSVYQGCLVSERKNEKKVSKRQTKWNNGKTTYIKYKKKYYNIKFVLNIDKNFLKSFRTNCKY